LYSGIHRNDNVYSCVGAFIIRIILIIHIKGGGTINYKLYNIRVYVFLYILYRRSQYGYSVMVMENQITNQNTQSKYPIKITNQNNQSK